MSKIIATATAVNSGGMYETDVKVRHHHLISDEPEAAGGADAGPAPGDYMCAALASCTVMTIRMYANRKQWKVDTVNVNVNLVKGTEMASGLNTFYCEVKVTGDLNDEQQKRLLEIAKACPVHRLLTKPSDVVTVIM